MAAIVKIKQSWNVVLTDDSGDHIFTFDTEQAANDKLNSFVTSGQATTEYPPGVFRVEIKRKWETDKSVISEIWINGENLFFGLEPARVNPVIPGHPCIPAGTYNVVLSMSPHLGYITPEVLNVPGRTAIRWHIANYPKDVIGCVAIGSGRAADMVLASKVAFDKLMGILNGAKSITAV